MRFQKCVNERVALVLKTNNYCLLDEVAEDDCQEEELYCTKFLPERWSESPITVKTDSITLGQLKELREYLLFGGSFSTHW